MTTANKSTFTRSDIHQEVTDTIISQLEAGTVPWHNQWLSNNTLLGLPVNFSTGNRYRGVNIILLWCAAMKNKFDTNQWGSYKQWAEKDEFVRKGEKGNLVIFYDTIDKEVDGEIEKIPFLKKYHVFNRCQLSRYEPKPMTEHLPCLIEQIDPVEEFIQNTGAIVQQGGDKAYYDVQADSITIPSPEFFVPTPVCTATEGYYSTLLHEVTHWTGAKTRLDRLGKSSVIDYAKEELVAELGAAFLCAGFEIASINKGSHATYIANYLRILKNDKQFIFKAASEASKAVDYLHSLQPQ
jgi:antirestriction protein ArdC